MDEKIKQFMSITKSSISDARLFTSKHENVHDAIRDYNESISDGVISRSGGSSVGGGISSSVGGGTITGGNKYVE